MESSPRGDVDDRDHTVIGHARRPDHTERPDDLAVHFIRRRPRRSFPRSARDSNSPPMKICTPCAWLDTSSNCRRLVFWSNTIEELAQPRHVGRKVRHFQQVCARRKSGALSPGSVSSVLAATAACISVVMSPRNWSISSRSRRPYFVEGQTREVCVDIVRRLGELRRRIIALRRHDAVLDIAFRRHDDEQDALVGQAQ